MHRNYILVMGVSCGLVGKQLTALLLTLESLGQFNTTPGEAASPRVLPCWVWQLEYSGVEGPILSKQTISSFALVFRALGCSPQGVDVVL